MPDEKGVAAGKRFARDMRRVREDRGVSLAAIHEQTQIAETLLESFEDGGLYDHSAFNEVYLRSFVRAYASVVGISPDEAVSGLESALRGDYQNALAAAHLEGVSPDAPERESEETADTTSEDAEPNRPDRSAGLSESEQPESTAATGATAEGATDSEQDTEDQERPTPPVNADDAPPHPSSVASSDRDGDERVQAPVLSIGAALLVVGVIGLGVWYALDAEDSQPASSPPDVSDTTSESRSITSARTSPPTASDTPDTSQASTSTLEPSDQLTLGDTLHLTLRADSTVSGLRMRRDEDLRRPYWIQQGEAAAFPFTSRAIIENDLDDVTVYLENRRVNLPPDTSARVFIDRQRADALLDNPEQGPAAWATPPDTIPTGPLSSDSSAN